MKLSIKSDGKKFTIILPTALFLNRLTATIATKIIKSKLPAFDISIKDFMKLINAIKRYKREHRRLEVVDINSSDGESIFVSL